MCLLQAFQSIGWPNDSQKYDIYTNEEEMYELLRKGYTTSSFQVNRQRQKTLEDTASMCCFLMFDSSLVIKSHAMEIEGLTSRVRTLEVTNEAHQQEILRLNEAHQQTIKKKMQLALLNDDLKNHEY